MQTSTTSRLSWLLAALLAVWAHVATVAASGEPATCSTVSGQAAIGTGGALLGDELEILSWNIQKASNRGWAEDLASFGDGVDLAFIQEASAQAGIADLFPGLQGVFAPGYTTAKRETGVLTLSPGIPSVHCKLTSLEPWLGTPKATSITAYELRDRGERLLAINLHAINFELNLESFQSQFQALAEVLADHRGPVILAGDLNTWSGSRQSLVDNFMREHGLASVAFEPDLRTTAFGRALDHIYVRGMRARTAQVIPVSSSDHNPLRVRLAID